LSYLQKAVLQDGALRKMLFSYQAAFIFQVSQSVACNGTHILEERCCRWLLMTHDRVEGNDIELTHEFLAAMLGVRRSSVTETLQALKLKGLIEYSRGKITVLDRQGLEDGACECYQDVRDEYDRLLK
jgi:CRP-like cAMP-binding protein